MNTSHQNTAASTSNEPQVSRMSQRLPIDAEILRRAKVAYADMVYDGWRGTRAIEPVNFRTSERRSSEPRLPPLVRLRVERVFHELLEARYPDWDAGDGARGGMIWFLKSDLLEHWHDVRVTTYRTTRVFNL